MIHTDIAYIGDVIHELLCLFFHAAGRVLELDLFLGNLDFWDLYNYKFFDIVL